ncbi:bifunctional DNA primase/polymerase [Sphaerobacter thermophilus]|uniref:Bifunctional DNA primase/polymerase n=1 Tax=Sphaerobacter thermophilus (strain ATCC 49802 / DSM 20745 / KCCM 41009 / NCIMB 13125 / S 6022) TaxID=479434 RepID=D1C3U4_SPHTD|nr:bifunctional DNA primase/polymerase [Sphaerobacter thermophilus]ACZ38911.1 Bifunctional DNA primase/polymerase [Sphaerobacter thermophilus DSM 20745]
MPRHAGAPAGTPGRARCDGLLGDRRDDDTTSAVLPTTGMVRHALAYAARGWPVFALAPRAKVPLARSRGHHDATTDARAVREWWALWPDANIGIALGGGRLVVLDVDRRHGGDATLAAVEREYEPLPPAPAVRTGDGLHLYYAAGGRPVPTRVLGPGLELRGDGAYVVAPPSIHPSGTRYQWADGRMPDALPPLPLWLLALTRHNLTVPAGERDTEPAAGTGAVTGLGAALARLLSDPAVLPRVLPLLGIPPDANPDRSRAFRCPLGCDDRHPSASLWRHPETGTVLVRSWHRCRGLEYLTLPMVYAGQRGRGWRWLRGAALAAWSLRLLRDAGVVWVPAPPPHLLHAPAAAAAVWHAFGLTVAAAEMAGDTGGVAFARRYGVELTGLPEHEYRAGWDWLRAHGYVVQASARAGRRPALWAPATTTTPTTRRETGLALREYSLRVEPRDAGWPAGGVA